MNEHDAFVSLSREDILQTLIRLALAEDVGAGDWTTRWTVPAGAKGMARIVAKSPLVVSGSPVTSAVLPSSLNASSIIASSPRSRATDRSASKGRRSKRSVQ